jgi:DNA-binding transcriptional LysR family regulator
MDLRQLRHFIAVAEEEHFSRAARRSNIVQSALSTSIRTLEDELGTQLFVRTTRKVRLTQAGRVLLVHARVVLDAARAASEAVARVAGLERATLRLGGVPGLPNFIDLAALLATFRERYPGVDVQLGLGNANDLVEKIREGQFDIVVLPLSEPLEGMETITVACDTLGLVCAPGHRFAVRKSVKLHDLADHSFVDFEQAWASRHLTDRAFEEAGISRHTAFEVSDRDTMLALVQRGLGIALMPSSALRRFSLPVVALTDPEIKWELVAACVGAAEALDPAARAFLDLMSEQGFRRN